MMSETKIVFVLGGPGCGKGTQAISISTDYGLGYAAAGDILRAKSMDPSFEHSKEIFDVMAAGKLVRPSLIVNSVNHAINNSNKTVFLMDGFPRSIEQDDAFRDRSSCYAVVFLDAPDEVLCQRIANRALTSERNDDNEEVVRKRIKNYKEQTVPVIERYQKEGKVYTVDASRSIPEVREDFLRVLRKLKVL